MAVEAVFRRLSSSEFRSILSNPFKNYPVEALSQALCRNASLFVCKIESEDSYV
jgi:hypothetical protein